MNSYKYVEGQLQLISEGCFLNELALLVTMSHRSKNVSKQKTLVGVSQRNVVSPWMGVMFSFGCLRFCMTKKFSRTKHHDPLWRIDSGQEKEKEEGSQEKGC